MSGDRTEYVRHARSHSGTRTGNRYDDRMVSNDVSIHTTPGALLVGRLHVDLCRLASAICRR
nr:putative leader peptide [Streptomyces longispororuber]